MDRLPPFKTLSRVGVVLLGWMAVLATVPGQAALPGAVPAGSAMASSATNAALPGGPDASTRTLEARLVEARANLAAALGGAAVTNAPAGVSPQDVWVCRSDLSRGTA